MSNHNIPTHTANVNTAGSSPAQPAASYLSYKQLLTTQSMSHLPTRRALHPVLQLQLPGVPQDDCLPGCHAATSTLELQAQQQCNTGPQVLFLLG
jgi:hypothetical protein